jgi:HlyD family secretion protein
VRKAPTTTSNVVTYETIIDVPNPEQKLFPGMTADASILVARKSNTIKIPNAALRYTPPQDALYQTRPPGKLDRGQRLVYALDGDGTHLRPIVLRVGITDGTDTEVLTGVTESTLVVVTTLDSGAPRKAFEASSSPTPPG